MHDNFGLRRYCTIPNFAYCSRRYENNKFFPRSSSLPQRKAESPPEVQIQNLPFPTNFPDVSDEALLLIKMEPSEFSPQYDGTVFERAAIYRAEKVK